MNALRRQARTLLGRVRGDYWTLAPQAKRVLVPPNAPAAVPFAHRFEGPVGDITLSGEFHAANASETEGTPLVIVVHGLGGSIDSGYTKDAANAAHAAGAACLRVNLRGANRNGDDIYHAGLTRDLDEVLGSEALRPYKDIYLIGYSLGGHLSLRYAVSPNDRRVRGIAAICPPVLLAAGVAHIDRAQSTLYRGYILGGLKDIFAAYAERGRPLPCSPAVARKVRTLREWDTRVVAPHFGFASAEEYWESQSVGPLLDQIRLPSLIVAAEYDPLVPYRLAATLLGSTSSEFLQTRVLAKGGHCGFPHDADLGLEPAGSGSVEAQVVSWLLGG